MDLKRVNLNIGEIMEKPEIEINFLPSYSERPGKTYNKSILAIVGKIENAGGSVAIKNPTKDLIISALIVSAPLLIKGLCDCLNSWLKARGGRRISLVVGGVRLKTTGLSRKTFQELIKDARKYERAEKRMLTKQPTTLTRRKKTGGRSTQD